MTMDSIVHCLKFSEGCVLSQSNFQAHELLAGLEVGLPLRLDLDFQIGFTHAPFDNVSSLPNPPLVVPGSTYFILPVTRTDEIVNLAMIVRRPINEWLEVSARYYYTRNISNVISFDYDRNVVGAYLTVGF